MWSLPSALSFASAVLSERVTVWFSLYHFISVSLYGLRWVRAVWSHLESVWAVTGYEAPNPVRGVGAAVRTTMTLIHKLESLFLFVYPMLPPFFLEAKTFRVILLFINKCSFEVLLLRCKGNQLFVNALFSLSHPASHSFHLPLIPDLIAACACKSYCTQPIMHSRRPSFLMTGCASSLSGHNCGC